MLPHCQLARQTITGKGFNSGQPLMENNFKMTLNYLLFFKIGTAFGIVSLS